MSKEYEKAFRLDEFGETVDAINDPKTYEDTKEDEVSEAANILNSRQVLTEEGTEDSPHPGTEDPETP